MASNRPLLPNGWDYEHHPDYKKLLPDRCETALKRLRRESADESRNTQKLKDSRGDHLALFIGLTPPYYPHFAGNYRGSVYPGLRKYNVHIPMDTRVGAPWEQTTKAMFQLNGELDTCLPQLDAAWRRTEQDMPLVQKILSTVRLACAFFVEFLRIHPYANGNGHMARFSIFAFLSRYNIWPKRWPLDERPPGPYSAMISAYRDGNRDGLEQFVLKCVLGIS
ncbi:MAG: Fic family protein [Halopseudomonas sp.]